MKRTGIFYGSSLGNTRFIAEKIHQQLPKADLIDVAQVNTSTFHLYDNLILGTSTWGVGNLQEDFELFVDLLINADLTDKTITFFGLGDQQTYPDTFANGMGQLYNLIKDRKCNFIGQWPIDDYDFNDSLAIDNGKFVGLALDEDNEPDLSNYRIKKWINEIKEKL